MKTKNRGTTGCIIAAGLMAAGTPWASTALAQHSHGEVDRAATFGEAIRRINDTLNSIDRSLDAGSIAGVSDQANALTALGRQLGALALAQGSGVPRESVREANLAGRDLAAAADALHNSADAGNVEASREGFARVSEVVRRLEGLGGATYFCPMHCEGAKVYAEPGRCPVCNMNLKRLTTEQYSVEVVPVSGAIAAGRPVSLKFTMRDPTGAPVRDLEIVHEMPLHLLMVSKDLSWYAHEHPELQADGTFTFTWTFPAPGEYTLFHDFTPKDVGMQVVPVTLSVPGSAASPIALVEDADRPKVIDGYTVTLDTGGPVTTGSGSHFAYTISLAGQPVSDLEPYLGAMGHLVIISEHREEFVHSHPHEGGEHAAEPHGHDAPGEHGHTGDERGGPRVDFEAHFASPGLYKSWAQFQHRGRVITVPFTFRVEPGVGEDAHEGGQGEGGGHGGGEHGHH